MTTILKHESEQDILRESGKRLAEALDAVAEAVKPGVSAKDLDDVARETIEAKGDKPAFLGYTPEGADHPFPASLCVSINEEIVHGIPRAERILKDGDIVSVDLGVLHEGLVTDSARTLLVGNITPELQKLVDTTKTALDEGIAAIRPGAHIGDIGFAIESFAKPFGYGIVRELGGHGVGKRVHEDPYVPNFGKKGTGPVIEEGMVLAIEPMLNLGSRHISMLDDGYTIRTVDGKPSAHFEHTVLVGSEGAEIITQN